MALPSNNGGIRSSPGQQSTFGAYFGDSRYEGPNTRRTRRSVSLTPRSLDSNSLKHDGINRIACFPLREIKASRGTSQLSYTEEEEEDGFNHTLRAFSSRVSNTVEVNERMDGRTTLTTKSAARSRRQVIGSVGSETSVLNNSCVEMNLYNRELNGLGTLSVTNGSHARTGSGIHSAFYHGETGWDYVGIYFKRACTSVTNLVHYVLMNLFVCEKWLLHREADWNRRTWKKLFWLIMILLTGWCLWNLWPLLWYPLESSKYLAALLRFTMEILWYPVGLLLYCLALVSSGWGSLVAAFSQLSFFNASVPRNCRGCSSDSAVLLARIGKLEERMDSFTVNFQATQNDHDRYSSYYIKIIDLENTVQEVRSSVQKEIEFKAQNNNEEYQKLMSKIDVLSKAVHANRRIIDELKDSNSNWKLEHEMLQRIATLDEAMKDVREHAHHAASDQTQLDLKSLLIKLESKVESMERGFNDQYSKLVAQLSSAVHNWEIKLEEEVTRLEKIQVQDLSEFRVVLDDMATKTEVPAAFPRDADPEILSAALLPIILPTIMENVHKIISEKVKDCEDTGTAGVVVSQKSVGCTDIEKIIRAAIAKYDADKTGLPDVALEPAGGSILSTRCTKSSRSKNSVLTLWGWRLWSYSNSPRSIIQPGVVPGDCWAVDGATAEVVIQLISPTVISGFTLEHIPKSISPYGKIDTAPRRFEVVGIMTEHDIDSIWNYGSYEYEDNNEPLQYFKVQNFTKTAYPVVELRVLSNHGNIRSTCIYRFRVHGEMTLTH